MRTSKDPKTKIEAFFTAEEIAKIQDEADRENRSRSAMIRELVVEALGIRQGVKDYRETMADRADGWRP